MDIGSKTTISHAKWYQKAENQILIGSTLIVLGKLLLQINGVQDSEIQQPVGTNPKEA